MKVKKVIGPLQNATAPQLGEKGHFAKLNKFAGKKEFSQKASPCANLFLNQRGRGTLTVPSHTLPPSEGVGSYVYRQTKGALPFPGRAPQLVEKEHFAKLNKFAGKELISQ